MKEVIFNNHEYQIIGLDNLLDIALHEDVGDGDITTSATISTDIEMSANLLAKQSLVVCGNFVAQEIIRRVDNNLSYQINKNDGALCEPGEVIATLNGKVSSILSAERVLLNFLQRLSGISTLTKKFKDQLDVANVMLLDTRKTTPGWRSLEKYAVVVGGGNNHRLGLYDQFLIKNNHIDANGGDIAKTIAACRSFAPDKRLEVEVRDIDELSAACKAKPDAILLDNMTNEQLRECVSYVREVAKLPNVFIEASGGVSLDTIAGIAKTGVDGISCGFITHSATAVDVALHIVK